jgi:hypothetical protein
MRRGLVDGPATLGDLELQSGEEGIAIMAVGLRMAAAVGEAKFV